MAKEGMEQDRAESCLFCKISSGEIPGSFVHEDDQAFAIRDINPQAPTHVLVIPREHIKNLSEAKDAKLIGDLFKKATEIAAKEKLNDGYRVVVNTGIDGGQTVHHLHIHVLGGRSMSWPPG